MASPVIQVKRGLYSNLPALKAGEPGFTTDKYDLFVGLDETLGNNQFFGSGRYWEREDGTNAAQLKLVDKDGSNGINLQVPDTTAGIGTWILPNSNTGSQYGLLAIASTSGDERTLEWTSITTNSFDATTLVIESEGISSNDSDTQIPTTAAVKDYVDTQITAQDLDFAGDTGTGAVDLDSQSFTIAGTSNEIETSASGQTITIGLPADVTIGQDLTVSRDIQIVRNLNVDGNITVGGTTATLFTQTLKVADADLILGIRTDGSGNDISTDNTASHGGIAIASTEGNPLITLTNPGAGETLPATYKKIMWFKAGSFSGLGTDAWLSNYAVGIGSTQFPTGTRLAVGNVQFTENDLAVVRNINSTGVSTLPTLDTTNATIDNLTFTSGTAITSVDTDLSTVSASDDTLASAKAIKSYVDAQITAQDLDFAGDTGTGAVELGSQSLSIVGTSNEIETSASGQTITIGLPDDVTIGDTLTVTGISTFQDRVIFDSTNSIQIPVGTEAQKDSVGVAVTGQIRYNTTNQQFEGFGVGNNWGSLGGVKDVDGDTYILAEVSAGSDEDILYFYTGGNLSGTISSTTGVDFNVDLNVDGHTETDTLNVSGVSTFTGQIDGNGGADISGGETTLSSATVSDLTSGRVVLAGTSGAIEDSANLTFDGTTLSAPTADLTNATIDNLTFTSGTAITSVDTDLATVSASDDTLASAKAIKSYVDSEVSTINTTIGNIDLDFAGDSGTGAVDLDSQTFTIAGTANEIETSGSGQTLTIGLPDDVTVSNNLTVQGNLTVNGTTTQVNTSEVSVYDRTITLGIQTGSTPINTTWDLGVMMNYGDVGVAKTAGVIWEYSTERFQFSANSNNPSSGTDTTAPQITVATFAPIEIGSLWVNDCAGQSQVISCTGSTRNLENITIDAGSF